MRSRLGQQISWTVFYALVRPFVRPLIGYRYKREARIHGPAIIMCNHNLDIDVGLLGLSYRQSMRVVASEHIFRMGILTVLIKLFFSPIVRMKGKTEIRTVRQMLNVVNAGGRVCIFPEGNRSYNGLTGEITRASASLARMAKCQLITYRIQGGYFKHPRWGRKGRRGPTSGREVGRYPAEQLAGMTTDEVLELIKRDLHEDAYARQEHNPAKYTGKNLAESLETALYLCPSCGGMGNLQSRGDHVFCACGMNLRYTETGMLTGMGATEVKYATVTAWDRWQQHMTEELVCRAKGGVITQDDAVSLYRVTPCEKDELLETGTLSISCTVLTCGTFRFPLQEISDLAIIGINTLVFETSDNNYYEIRSKSAYNALKYRRFYLHCRNTAKGECGQQDAAQT